MATYNYKPGLGNASSYQVSSIPYVKGPIDNAPINGGPYKITFPLVTRFVTISNADTDEVLIGFSANGLQNETNAFAVPPEKVVTLELKVTELYYTGSSRAFSVVAGLTGIETININNFSVSPSGSNWSGSLNANVG